MKDRLASRILSKLLQWRPEDDAAERSILKALAEYKYDEYQQFSPGMRYVESLIRWLDQFESLEDRKLAYQFIKKNLIFVSEAEMKHLVSITYPDVIRLILLRLAAERIGAPEWALRKIADSPEFRVLQRQSLFLGMSDGGRTDYFRRSNPVLSNEQVRMTQEVHPDRAHKMIDALKKDLSIQILKREATPDEARFRAVFLLDDFSASGLSYLRRGDKGFEGKLSVFGQILNGSETKNMFSQDELTVCVVLYIATTDALRYLNSLGKELFPNIDFNVSAVCPLEGCRIDETDSQLISLLKRYCDPKMIDSHLGVGKTDKPYLGFDECGLPLVLAHNTPNNSLPLLWYSEHDYRALFPRTMRHVDRI